MDIKPDQAERNETSKRKEPIAIVGIGCRYPGGCDTPEKFWNFIVSKNDGFMDIPKDRWNLERFHDSDEKIEGATRPKQAAFLFEEDLKGFDAPFFNFAPREAECLDPQQRLLLQTSWEALENANIKPSDWSGHPVGVYVGGFTIDNYLLQCSSENMQKIDQATASSSTLVMLSNRLSYFYDFKGPSLSIDTACSSSLVALNYACQDLWQQKTEAALVGGVNAMIYPALTITMGKGGFLSPDSRSKTFDAKANGYARGEGAGVLVLKPLSKAIADADRIYATILSTGVNQDGRTAGIASPNGDSQSELITTVMEEGDINAQDIVMIEAHGTGTAVGDPTEISALGRALGPRTDGKSRHISSIKGNIGHQEAGAGVAGIIKTALSLYHDQIPPQANMTHLNPALNLKDGSFKVPTSAENLIDQEASKLASVNSFGYGGTNAHSILGAYQGDPEKTDPTASSEDSLLLFSAKSEAALQDKIIQTRHFLQNDPNVSGDDLIHTLACGRENLDLKIALPTPSDPAQICNTLDLALTHLQDGTLKPQSAPSKSDQGIVFLYTGMGPQWWAMGRELYHQNPVFKNALDAAEEAFIKASGFSILDQMIHCSEDQSEMARNKIAQPANFVLQHGLTELLKSWGITPSCVIGHSVGEVSAALASGALTLEQAGEVAYHRSRLQQLKAGQGRMMATGLDLETARTIVDIYENDLSIGAINSPSSVALAGTEATLRMVGEELEEQGIFHKLIFGEVAYHSHQMEDLKEPLFRALGELKPAKPNLPLYSTTLGEKVETAVHDVHFWWANVRQPVLFDTALSLMAKDGYDLFVEVGPHPVLSGAISQVFAPFENKKATVLSSLKRNQPEKAQLLSLASDLWKNNALKDWAPIFAGRKLNLASYPWQNEMLWRESEQSRSFRLGEKASPLLGYKTSDAPHSWENTLDGATLECLKGHIIDAKPIFPAAGYVEAFSRACQALFPNEGFGLSNITFEKLLPLPLEGSLASRVTLIDQTLSFYAREIKQDQPWQLYARAQLVQQTRTAKPSQKIKPLSEAALHFDKTTAYETLGAMGLDYQNDFCPISEAHVDAETLSGGLTLSEDFWTDARLDCHPALLDGGLQLLALALRNSETPPVPTRIGQYTLHQPLNASGIHLTVQAGMNKDGSAYLFFYREDGTLALELNRVQMQNIPRQQSEQLDPVLYETDWSAFEENAAHPPLKTAEVIAPIDAIDPLRALQGEADLNSYIFVAGSIEGVSSQTPNAPEIKAYIDFINARDEDPDARLILLTQGACILGPNDQAQPAQAALLGVSRTARHENPKRSLVNLDLPAGYNDWTRIGDILAQLPENGEFAWREGQLWQMRLSPFNQPEASDQDFIPRQDKISAVLSFNQRNGLSSLHYQGDWRRAPQDHEIEVEMAYCALNLKDILKVLGRLTDQSLKGTFFQHSLGMESSGTVVRVGAKSDYKVGERVVFGHKHGSFKSYLTFDPEDTFILRWGDLPLELEDLATLPITYVSAHYGLKMLANLSAGESVLIHSASGGVGHAALNVAKQAGARIIATAGTEEKRAYIKQLGIEHVFNSRNLDFEQDVLEATDHEGVDVVLNFLPDALLHANLRILKPFGHLIELGKADIGANKGLPLEEFERNLTFSAIDIDHMLRFRRPLFNRVTDELKVHFDRADYHPLPVIKVDANDPVTAFKQMAEGGHIGKILLDFSKPVTKTVFPKPTGPLFAEDASYLVTGGTKGFGLECAKWMMEKGAKSIVLMSRSLPTDETLIDFEAALEDQGGKLHAIACDVGDKTQLEAALLEISNSCPPIKGIFHGAAVLYDAPMMDLGLDAIEKSLHAKAMGALHLHDLSVELKLELDHFVAFSSISGLIGNAGQANYAAANTYLDALMRARRQTGLPGTSIAWGSLDEVGMVARDETVSKILKNKGITALKLKDALSHLEDILKQGLCHVGCFDVDWDLWQKRARKVDEQEPVYTLLSSAQGGAQQQTLLSQLQSGSVEDYEDITCAFLAQRLGDVLNVKPASIGWDKPVTMHGIDSLMSIEFQLAVESHLGCKGIALAVNLNASLRDLSQGLIKNILASKEFSNEDGETDQEDGALPADIDVDALSDEEVSDMLSKMLEPAD